MDGLAQHMNGLGHPDMTPALRQAGGRSVAELATWENEMMAGLLKLRGV